ncbi:MAG: SGNH/GDSL hydrolase family protein [Candidatus Taylorbacteria bacterium]|nr:SGNH/GDSL hydrolase family protein [bacterium]MCR4311399.1 SGNH/GDSL hydrolase family protein [Candidatus Taylorbacteria bacterium]
MKYLALGDSISIDDYTGVPYGGAANQFARIIKADPFQNLTQDGWTTFNVFDDLTRVTEKPDIITLTVGGNDLLAVTAFQESLPTTQTGWHQIVDKVLQRIKIILDHIAKYNALLILNTVYDPTDGQHQRFEDMCMPSQAGLGLTMFNNGIRRLARMYSAKLCDLEFFFRGHGFWSKDPWLTKVIEPNFTGATAIAIHWAVFTAELL